jgi:predicted ArsR family transcriptional regulator
MIDERPSIPRNVELRSSLVATKVLWRRLGLRAIGVLGEVGAAQARGDPFRHLPKPRDLREELSRRQAAPAVLLFKALRKRLGGDEALSLTREVILEATVIFLGFAIGPLDRDELMALSEAEREALVRRLGVRFFNATVRWDEISSERLRLTVTHCLFPDLCREGGAPEVAPLLCQGDAVYFEEVLGTVELNRPGTIAEGAEVCPFELRWKTPAEV